MTTYRLTQDVIIPAGTRFVDEPGVARYFADRKDIVIEHGVTDAENQAELEEFMALGVVEKVEDDK